jgi:hypothetical protein
VHRNAVALFHAEFGERVGRWRDELFSLGT